MDWMPTAGRKRGGSGGARPDTERPRGCCAIPARHSHRRAYPQAAGSRSRRRGHPDAQADRRTRGPGAGDETVLMEEALRILLWVWPSVCRAGLPRQSLALRVSPAASRGPVRGPVLQIIPAQ